MTIQTASASTAGTSVLSNSIRTQYIEEYLEAAMAERLYDQIATPVGKNMEELKRGSSVQVEFLSQMEIGTTAISETTDITPQALKDATGSITPTSRGEAIQASELLLVQAYTDYGAKQYQRVGQNMMESVDALACSAAVNGDLVLRPANTTRILLAMANTGHRANDALFSDAATWLQSLKAPGFVGPGNGKSGANWAAIMQPGPYHDIREDGNVVSIAQYQQASIILNFELGQIGPFRLVVSPWAKAYYGAGAVHATDTAATTSNAAVNALGTSIRAASNIHLDNVQWLNIGTLETGSTLYPMNERVRGVSLSGSTVSIVGSGENSGFRYPHASGCVINNGSSVYTIVFGGPASLAKVYATEIGEFGEIVGPKRDGLVDQWVTLGWKWYGNYGILRQGNILRAEVACSADLV